MNAAADRLEDGYPHGTPEGWAKGCRGAVCPAADEHGLSCKRAKQLAASDYQYQKLARRGLSPATIALELGLVPEGPTTPVVTPKPPTPAQPLAESAHDRTPPEQPAGEADAPVEGPAQAEHDTVGKTRGNGAPKRKSPTGPPQSVVRAWAKAHGIPVNPKGTVSADVVTAYLNAHPTTPTPVTSEDLDAWAQDHVDHTPPPFSEQLDTLRTRIDMPTPPPRPDWGELNIANEVETARKNETAALALAELHQQLTDRARATATRYADELAIAEARHERQLRFLLEKWDAERTAREKDHAFMALWRRHATHHARVNAELVEQRDAALAEVARLSAAAAAETAHAWWKR